MFFIIVKLYTIRYYYSSKYYIKRLQDFAKYSIIEGAKYYDLYPQYHFKEYAHTDCATYLIKELALK